MEISEVAEVRDLPDQFSLIREVRRLEERSMNLQGRSER